MSYQHEHIPYYTPQEWYERIASQFNTYHKKLNEWDNAIIRQYLPRSTQWLRVLDLWGADWRRAKKLDNVWIKERTIIDTCKELLDRAPKRTKTIHADLLQPLPLDTAAYDLIICTFVLLHLEELQTVCEEIHRCLAPTWRVLIVHHHERRPFIHATQNEEFKIKTRHWSFDELEETLTQAGLVVDVFDAWEQTKIYCCFCQ